MNNLQKQLSKLSQKIENETKKLTPDELFSKKFLSENHIHKTIQEIFDSANVDFSHINSLSQDEKQNLISALSSTKFKTWEDFVKAAVASRINQNRS